MDIAHGGHCEIVEDEDLGFGEGFDELWVAPVGAPEIQSREELR